MDALAKQALKTMMDASRKCMEYPRTVIVYGSHAQGNARTNSDLDVLFIGTPNPGAVEYLTQELIRFSKKYGLDLDEEVPYSNKILCDWRELAFAATCRTFRNHSGRRTRLTPVDRRPQFLRSKTMRERLFINVLTQRTVSISDVEQLLLECQVSARRNIVRAAIDTLEADEIPVTEASIVDILIGVNGLSGKDHLGFEDDASTAAHLSRIARNELTVWVKAPAIKRKEAA